MPSIREMLAKGDIAQSSPSILNKVQDRVMAYWDNFNYDDNGFILKQSSKKLRMEKSHRARCYRKQIKQTKQHHLEREVTRSNWYNKKLH